jgi:hypothetical protein
VCCPSRLVPERCLVIKWRGIDQHRRRQRP